MKTLVKEKEQHSHTPLNHQHVLKQRKAMVGQQETRRRHSPDPQNNTRSAVLLNGEGSEVLAAPPNLIHGA